LAVTARSPCDGCKDRVKVVNKACTDSKQKGKEAQADWKKNKCGMLNIKPAFGKRKGETLEDAQKRGRDSLEGLRESIENLNVDTIKKQLEDEVGDLLSIGVGDVAWQGAKKLGKRFVPIYGWVTIPGDLADADDFFELVDIYEKKLEKLKKDIPEYPQKIDDLTDAINKGDTATASRILADMQADYALINKCLRARKCLLVPYSDTDPSCKSKNKDAKKCSKGKDSSKFTKEEKKKLGCCKGQTGHHLMPDSYFTLSGKGNRGVADKKICKGYSECEAPTVCVEGANQYHGSHGMLHDATDVYAKEEADGDKLFGYETARDAVIKAHKTVFPLSFCKDGCLKKQLDDYYKCACGFGSMSPFNNEDVKARTSTDKGIEPVELNKKNKSGGTL
jgi:hypothetical protein